MKTYILRDPKAVEPQNRQPQPQRHPRRHDPASTATGDVICGPATTPPATPPGPRLFLGLDVHNDSIAVSLAPGPPPPRCPGCGRVMILMGAVARKPP